LLGVIPDVLNLLNAAPDVISLLAAASDMHSMLGSGPSTSDPTRQDSFFPSSHKSSKFLCKRCFKEFKTSSAFGGHTSKAHPGESERYAEKMKKRKERKPDRFFLGKAKTVFAEIYPG
jgi:hypothetical protein